MRIALILMGWLLATSFIQDKFYATWYGEEYHGRITKSGEVFDMNKMTCASNHFKIGTKLKVTNIENGKSVVVRINDTGSFKTKTIDLSKKAFSKIADVKKGRIEINVKQVK